MLRLIVNHDYTPNAKQLRINEKKTAILNHLMMMWTENFIDGRKYWSYRAILGAALARNGRYSERALRMINTDGLNTICVFYIQDFIFMTRQLIHLMMQDRPALYLISGGKDDTPGMRQIRRNMKAWDRRKKKSEPPRYR